MTPYPLQFSHLIDSRHNRQAVLEILGLDLNVYIEELEKSEPCPRLLDELHSKLEACIKIHQRNRQRVTYYLNSH